jgi:hypothetical protein
MADTRRTFQKGVMNQDLDERLLPNGSYISAENVTVNSYASGDVGAIQNAYGNSLKGNIITGTPGIISVINTPTITNPIVIGAVAYEPKGLIYWLVTANEFDAVFEYNIQSDQLIRVLQCSKPSPGSPLNFNSNYIVTGINYLEGQDGNNYLFWTDNYNPPRRININRCKGYTADDPSIADDISVIMAPPLNAPYISLSQNNSPDSTNLKEKFVYFSYRYKYIDNEYSSMSPFSGVGFEAGPFAIDYETGDNTGMINQKNLIDIHFETGNEFVKEIQLLVRDTRSLNVMVIESFDKDKLSIQDNTTYSFTFRNNKIYTTLSNEQVTRLFDNVPLKALGQDIIGNRLIYGNYLQFRNITNANDVDININFKVSYVSESISGNKPKRSFRSDRDYEVGIVYTDEYGRMTTVLTPALSNSSNILSNAVYIPPTSSDKANSLQIEISNEPPSWATNYRLVLKQNRQEYYNIFPRLYECNGLFRYFLINESDRDKFGVGDYIIVKRGGNGVTYSNKQFKILEVELKNANFTGNSLAGLYFKIKIDPTDVPILPPVLNNIVYQHSSQGTNRTSYPGTGCIVGIQRNSVPVLVSNNNLNTNSYTAEPTFYGANSSSSTALKTITTLPFTDGSPVFPIIPATSFSGKYYGVKDLRYTIEIQANNTFRYTVNVNGSGGWIQQNIPIISNKVYSLKLPSGINSVGIWTNPNASNTAFFIVFDSSNFSVGDKWKVSCRAINGGNYWNPSTSNQSNGLLNNQSNQNGGFAIVTGNFKDPIYAGATIKIDITGDSQNQNFGVPSTNTYTATSTYKNIEEWFVESGAYTTFLQKNGNGTNVGANGIWFRNVKVSPTNQIFTLNYPIDGNMTNSCIDDKNSNAVAMIIRGYGGSNNCTQNIVNVSFKIDYIDPTRAPILETVPLDMESEIFHELSRTYPIKNGKHISRWFFTGKSNGSLGSTRLNQSSKEWPHYFSVGDTVYINTNGVLPTTAHTITGIINRYSIDVVPSIPLLPASGGSVSYTTYEQDQTSVTNGAKIQINYPDYPNGDYNSFTYNTGLETCRIKDAFNAPVMKYSPRVTTVIEDYEEEYKFASLTYSGVFQASTSLNRLNEFNLSLANFKNLDKRYGSVQKLKARNTDLLVLHQDKITSVLYGKNLLYDAVGGSQIASIPEVLGNQIAYPGEFGISDNPESFATWSDVCYFADEKRGSVIKLIGDEVIPISTQGMGSFWIETMRDNPTNFKFGGFDPYNGTYVISVSDRQKQNCQLDISPSIRSVNSSASVGPAFMFSINTLSPSWTISIVDNGFGTSWVNCQTVSGSYSQFVYASYASNISGAPRSVIFRVTYCGGTLFKDFILTQGVLNSPTLLIPMVNG